MTAYLEHALRDARIVELRHFHGDRITSSLHADLGSLLDAIRVAERSGNVYTSLNRPMASRIAEPTRALRDSEIERIVRLPIDFDPVRPRGANSTADELALAVAARDRFVSAMHSLGWPMPALAVSGNGAHALHRLSLPSDERTRSALRTLYTAWRGEFSTDEVIFDSSVHNPSRIWRLYGTVNRKGPQSAGRPQRVAEIVVPHRWQAVEPDLIYRLANLYAHRQRRVAQPRDHRHLPIVGHGDYRTLDVVGWMQAHGMYRRPIGAGKHAVRCPWGSEHSSIDPDSSTSTVIWETDGTNWPTWHCSHAHCQGRTIRDVLALWRDGDRFCARPWRRAAA